MRWVALIITGLVLALGSAQPSGVGAQRVPILTATSQAPTTPRSIPIRGVCPVAYDLPVAHVNGEIWDAADYAKILACLEAVKPRILQPVPLRLAGAGTLNTDTGFAGQHTISYVGNTTDIGVLGFEFILPADYVTLHKAVIRCMDQVTSGNIVYIVYAYYSSVGETYNAHSNTLSPASPLAFTLSVQQEINIAALFSGIPAGALVSIAFERLGSDILDTGSAKFGVFALDIEYTP